MKKSTRKISSSCTVDETHAWIKGIEETEEQCMRQKYRLNIQRIVSTILLLLSSCASPEWLRIHLCTLRKERERERVGKPLLLLRVEVFPLKLKLRGFDVLTVKLCENRVRHGHAAFFLQIDRSLFQLSQSKGNTWEGNSRAHVSSLPLPYLRFLSVSWIWSCTL